MNRQRPFELAIDFVCRRERNLQVVSELPLASLPGTFRDVVRDGVDCSEKLRTEARSRAAERPAKRRVVARNGKRVGFLPDVDSSEGVHGSNMASVSPIAAP